MPLYMDIGCKTGLAVKGSGKQPIDRHYRLLAEIKQNGPWASASAAALDYDRNDNDYNRSNDHRPC